MRRIIDWVALIAIAGGVGYFAYTDQAQIREIVRMAQNKVAPCSSPLTYSIGSIDARFDIPKSILLSDLKDAERIWETASGKNLFEYKQTGGSVTINLIYDNRQASTDKLRASGIQVSNSQSSYLSLKARYDALSAQVTSEQSHYSTKAAAFRRDEAAYNNEVEQANGQGGATPAEYAQIEADKSTLEQQFAEVRSLENTLNADIDTLNALATTLNQLIVQLNLDVAQYNQVGASAGSYEEGLYEFSGGVQKIDIYEYSDHVQLVRVLAHEMGHALGLGHVSDPKAIMYKINDSENLTATAADSAELDRACSSAF